MAVINEEKQNNTEKEVQYDEWGINVEYNNPRSKGVPESEIQEGNRYAKYYRYKLNLNVIPAHTSKGKGFYLMKYSKFQHEDMGEELFKHCLDIGVFHDGMGVITGEIWRGEYKGKFFNLVDCDNLKGKNAVLRDFNGVVNTTEQLAEQTIIDTNSGSIDRMHVYFISERPIREKEIGNIKDENGIEVKPAIEIKSNGRIAIVANSYKPEKDEGRALNRTEIMMTEAEKEEFKRSGELKKLPRYLNLEETDQFEKLLDLNLRKEGVEYLKNNESDNKSNHNNSNHSSSSSSSKSLADMLKDDFKVYDGENRQGVFISCTEKYLIFCKKNNLPVTYESLNFFMKVWNDEHVVPPLEPSKFDIKLEKAIEFMHDKNGMLEGEREVIDEIESLGVNVEYFRDHEQLEDVVKNLMGLIREHKLEHETPKDHNVAADEILEKYPQMLKTFKETDEMLFFTGKIFERYGEKTVMEELEEMRQAENHVTTRLSELGTKLEHMIIRRDKIGKDAKELKNYLYALTEELFVKELSQMTVTRHFRNEVISNIMVQTYVNHDAFTTDINTIVVNNCVIKLDIRPNDKGTETLTWKAIDHSPEILSLNLLPVNYDPDAKCTIWDAFLDKIMYLNSKTRRNIQKSFGYALYKRNKFQKGFMFFGVPDTGKSITMTVLEHLVGIDNCSSATLQALCDGNQFATAVLSGKMINTCADLDITKVRNTGKLKMLTSGDQFPIEKKGKEPFLIIPTVKLYFSTNTIPESEDDSAAHYKRWIILPFNNPIPIDEQDTNLITKITENEKEMSGVLNFALEGLKMLLSDGGFDDIGTIADVKRMYEINSNMVKAFLDDCKDIVPNIINLNGENKYRGELVEQVQTEFLAYLRKEHNKGLVKAFINIKMFDDDNLTDLDNKIVKDKISVMLGMELKNLGVTKRRLRNEKGELHYYYVNLKSKVDSGWGAF